MKDFDLKKYLAENKLLKENEEQGYTLYTSNVEYDNGKTGYMYQLVNSEDREENEIGFDQLYFDDEDNRLEMGVDFKDFDQGSYQEEEVSAEEAMKIYNELKYKENKIAQAIRDEAEQEDSKVGAAIFKKYAKKIESAPEEDYRKILTSMERELIDTHPDTFDGDDDIVASFMALAEGKLEERETEFTRNRPARIDQFISELDNLLDDYHAELYLKDDVFSGIEAVKRAALGPDTATEN